MGKTGVAMFDPRVTGGFVSGDDAVSILVSEGAVGAAGDACASALVMFHFFR
jgi:hypothetical protein